MDTKNVSTDVERSQNSHTISSLPSMEKLDGRYDYGTWKFQMELHLIHEDLWEYTATTPNATDVQGIKKDQKARAKICLMVKPHCLVHVRQSKTAKEAWDALKNAFEDKGLNNRCRLLSRLVSIKLENFKSLRDYVTTIMTVAQQLRDLDKQIDDELLAALMLQGLTEKFQPLRMAIENSNTTLTTDYVKSKLFQMEEDYIQGDASSSTNALICQKPKLKKKSKKFKTKHVKCFICDGPHKARECSLNPKKGDAAVLHL